MLDFRGRNGEYRRGKRDQGLGLCALEIGWWSYRPRICDCFYCARGRENHLQGTGRPGGRASRMGFVVSKVSNSGLGALELKADYETVLILGIQEILDSGKCITKQETGANSSAIANAQPDHFRRASTQNAQF